MSKSVLRDVVSSGSKSVVVEGRSWQRTPRQAVGIEGLKARILCKRHNNALSPFDTTARSLGVAITDCIAHVWDGAGERHSAHACDGGHLERWLLKVLIGTLVTNGAKYGAVAWKPPERWLRVVFEGEAFDPGTGLYFVTLGRQRISRSIYVLPVGVKRDGALVFMLRFGLRALELLLVPPDVDGLLALSGPSAILHRPDELRFEAKGRSASVHFAWPGQKRYKPQVWRAPVVSDGSAVRE